MKSPLQLWLPLTAATLLAGCSTSPIVSQATQQAELHLQLAMTAEASGDRVTAASLYEAAARDDTVDSGVQIRAARGLARNGRPAEAEQLLEHQVQLDPTNMMALRALGAIQVISGQAPAALETLSRVLARNPQDARALADKGVALDLLHRHQEAQALYREALKFSPNDPSISNDLAVSYLLSGRLALARQTLSPYRGKVPERIRRNMGVIEAASAKPPPGHGPNPAALRRREAPRRIVATVSMGVTGKPMPTWLRHRPLQEQLAAEGRLRSLPHTAPKMRHNAERLAHETHHVMEHKKPTRLALLREARDHRLERHLIHSVRRRLVDPHAGVPPALRGMK